MKKKILYVDMDNVLVDFRSGIDQMSNEVLKEYEGSYDDIPGIFAKMKPVEGAIEAYKELNEMFDTYILSTSPWENETALTDKLRWVKKYLGDVAHKRLIFSHHKNLNCGDFLIDDRLKRGVDKFKGEHIHFGTEKFPDWKTVVDYLKEKS
jgi:5'(3')-deoxyribonucleotidase